MAVKPLEDRVLVKPVEKESVTSSGLYLPESSSYPTGGPHFRVRVSGTGSVTFYQSNGTVSATVASGDIAEVFIREDSDNVREPVIISTGVS